VNSINIVPPRQPHGVTKPRTSDRAPLVFTVILHVVVLTVLIWFGQNLTPLPVPKHIQAIMLPPPAINNPASELEAEPKNVVEPTTSAMENPTAVEKVKQNVEKLQTEKLKIEKQQIQKQQIQKQQIAEQQIKKQQKAEERKTEQKAVEHKAQQAAEAAAAARATEKAAAAVKQQEKVQIAKAQATAAKQAEAKKQAEVDKQVEVERAYALKKSQHAEKLKTEIEEKRLAKEAKTAEDKAAQRVQEKKEAEEAKKQAVKQAHEDAKAEKVREMKAAKAIQEKVDKEQASKDAQAQAKADSEKAQKEQAAKDAKAQEKSDKLKAAKEAADAKRRLTQSLGNDDAEMSSLKGQIAANAKANSVGKYAAQIKSHIKSAWHVPAGSSGLKAIARFTLNANGSVASVVITKSSGNDDFDASIKALRSLSGVPVPDDSDSFGQVNAPSITFVAP
jgi:TonB family protein